MWRREKRAILETREFGGVRVFHVIGWVGQRHCGCHYTQGMRLDKKEMTFGAGACELHGAQIARAMDAFLNMPPSEREAHVLFEELVEHDMEASGVRA